MIRISRTTQVAVSFFLAASCAAIQAQTPDPCATAPQTCATTINTRASASRRLPNSVVDVAVGITASDKAIAGAQRQLAERTANLLGYLRAQHVERLITNSVNVSPRSQSEKNGPDRIVGYSASTSISFRTGPAAVTEILSGMLSNGADTIGSTSFTATEEQLRVARSELSAEAVRAAIAQANAIAKAAEMHGRRGQDNQRAGSGDVPSGSNERPSNGTYCPEAANRHCSRRTGDHRQRGRGRRSQALTRRPGHSPAAEHVQVEMMHGLATIRSRIDHNAIAVGKQLVAQRGCAVQ